MILPPVQHDVKVISIGMFVPGNQPVVWRGPMLHRALSSSSPTSSGATSTCCSRPAARDRRCRDLGRPAHPGRRDPRRHDTPAGGGGGGRARRFDRLADPPAGRRRHREHVVARAPDGSRQEIFGSGGGQAVADSLTRSIGAEVSPCSARSRSTPRCGSVPTKACPWCSASPTPLPPWPCAGSLGVWPHGPAAWPDAPRPHPRRPLTPTSASCRSWVFRWPRRPSRTHVRMEPCSRRRPSPPSRSPQRRPPRGQLAPTVIREHLTGRVLDTTTSSRTVRSLVGQLLERLRHSRAARPVPPARSGEGRTDGGRTAAS